MVVRCKNGSYWADNKAVLLEYLGIKKDTEGKQEIKNDVELIASVPFRLKEGEEGGESFPWTLSTFDLDRFGERIDPQGWELKRYMENPVVEWAHKYEIPAIGKMEGLTIDEAGLHGLVVFNDKSYDIFGWSIEQRVKAGVIRGGSVGFRVLEIEIPSKEDSKDGTSLIFRKQELLEFSICNVPANPWALAKQGIGSGESGIGKSEDGIFANQYWAGLINNM